MRSTLSRVHQQHVTLSVHRASLSTESKAYFSSRCIGRVHSSPAEMGGNGFLHSHSHAFNSNSFPFPFPVLWRFPFLPIPIPFPWTYFHSHSHAVDRNIMNLLATYVKKTTLLKTAIPELCRFCFILLCSVSKKHYRKRDKHVSSVFTVSAHRCAEIGVLLYSITIYHSRWWESIPRGIGVIPIPISTFYLILVPFPWDYHGTSIPIGILNPMHISTLQHSAAVANIT